MTRASFLLFFPLFLACTSNIAGDGTSTDADATPSTSDLDGGRVPETSDGAPPTTSEPPPDAGPDGAPISPKKVCALPGSDGGVAMPAPVWTATPGFTATGTPVVAGSMAQPDCTLDLSVSQTGAMPPRWAIYLEKKDTTPGSCQGKKGFRTLVSATYEAPIAFLTFHPSDPTLVVVVFDHKNTPSGSSPTQLQMMQIDWEGGATLHHASKWVAGTPPPGPPPPARPTSVKVEGCDVVLRGTGTFSGASGTPTSKWEARYVHFLAPEPQPASPASSATYL